ncbi:BETA-ARABINOFURANOSYLTRANSFERASE RAY1 [Salix koriyanagi]|uniref:BETA-ARABINOFURANOSYLTRANSFERASE RAY1 n=1 Tax=Salix koriyanagi TaxID=2511006 RepID=A0A9Q1AHC3_9ROSI|nr:BETA-ARABINOFURANOSYLTRANSFERASE RAY1 [Salix koriyanagi]
MEGDVCVTPNLASSHATPRLGAAAAIGHGNANAVVVSLAIWVPIHSSQYFLHLLPLDPTKLLLFDHGLLCPLKSLSFCSLNTLLLPPLLVPGFWLIQLLISRSLAPRSFIPCLKNHGYTRQILLFLLIHGRFLVPDLISTLNYAYELDRDWLLVASLRNVSYFPFRLDDAGEHWLREDGQRVSRQELQEMLGRHWQWSHCEEDRMLMAWNNRNIPLHNGVLPPFLYGKGFHNHWIINEAVFSEFRLVFDASRTISCFSVNYPEHRPEQPGRGSSVLEIDNRSWEDSGNSHLGALYGSMFFHEINYTGLVKLLNYEGKYVFTDITEDSVYPSACQTGSQWARRVLRSFTKRKDVASAENVKSQNRILNCSLRDRLKSSGSLDFPFSLESLLSIAADKNKTVVLAVAGYSYKDMLMSWVCRLRLLQVTNFIICALDHETYQFSVLQGLPVFHDPSAPRNISFDDCHFGTTCFQRVTKVKSRMVLTILKLGYNVLLSDVDVYWFGNPLPLLYSFRPGVLVAQSDEYNDSGPINLPRRLNSGFYFARSDVSTVAAMEKVVKHAATSNLSEQPSFYDTLCGEGGSYRISDNRCMEPETNLTVHFLDRNLFPNGAYLNLWQKKNVKKTCRKKGCLVLHNNWISGRMNKLNRQEIFKNPQESLIWPYEKLLPGHIYLIIPSTTAQKLTHKHTGTVRVKGFAEGKYEIIDVNITSDASRYISEKSVGSEREFYTSKDRWPRYKVKRTERTVKAKKPFVPPFPKPRSSRGSGWEPSLDSAQEVSP